MFWGRGPKRGKPTKPSFWPRARRNLDILRSWSMEYDMWSSWSNPEVDILIYWDIYEEILMFWGRMPKGGKRSKPSFFASRAKDSRYFEAFKKSTQFAMRSRDIALHVYNTRRLGTRTIAYLCFLYVLGSHHPNLRRRVGLLLHDPAHCDLVGLDLPN